MRPSSWCGAPSRVPPSRRSPGTPAAPSFSSVPKTGRPASSLCPRAEPMFGFFRKPSPEERQRSDAVKAMVREILGLGAEVTVSVSEIQCGDVTCPGTETVILVLQKGLKTRAYKIQAPLLEADRDAVA